MGLPYIRAHRTGSSFICDPPVLDTDIDIKNVLLTPDSVKIQFHGWCIFLNGDDTWYLADTAST